MRDYDYGYMLHIMFIYTNVYRIAPALGDLLLCVPRVRVVVAATHARTRRARGARTTFASGG